MSEADSIIDLASVIITALGSLGVGAPIFLKIRTKLAATKALINEIEEGLKDGKLTAPEMRAIIRLGKAVIDK